MLQNNVSPSEAVWQLLGLVTLEEEINSYEGTVDAQFCNSGGSWCSSEQSHCSSYQSHCQTMTSNCNSMSSWCNPRIEPK